MDYNYPQFFYKVILFVRGLCSNVSPISVHSEGGKASEEDGEATTGETAFRESKTSPAGEG